MVWGADDDSCPRLAAFSVRARCRTSKVVRGGFGLKVNQVGSLPTATDLIDFLGARLSDGLLFRVQRGRGRRAPYLFEIAVALTGVGWRNGLQ
jgi:hypothetical protein